MEKQYQWQAILTALICSGKQTGGAYAVIDMLVPPGGGPDPHSHAAFHESFYVLDGAVEIKPKMELMAEKGSFAEIPIGGLVHCCKNKINKVAHLWCVVVPAGFEDFLKKLVYQAISERSFHHQQ